MEWRVVQVQSAGSPVTPGVLSPDLLRAAILEADRLAVPLPDQMLATGLVSEAALYGSLASSYGLPFEPPDIALHPRASWRAALSVGIAPLVPNPRGLRFVAAPRGDHLVALDAALHRTGGEGIAIATPATFRGLVDRRFGASISREAADSVADVDSAASARDGLSWPQVFALHLLVGLTAFFATLAPSPTALVGSAVVGLLFFANIGLRLVALKESGARPEGGGGRIADRDLPVYTILVPLYRETRILNQLVGALLALDYPLAKLDIKLLLEADDVPMQEAVRQLRLPGAFETIIAPPGRPRTKPRALNVGLASARGEFVVVYDAEDRPDPRQLRAAVARFQAADTRLVCLQGHLVIDNTGDSWLTRLFTIEYATLFGVLVPGLANLRLPVMLGGTTNHFRVGALRCVGAWDAWNVTEDADLGLRLAREGYDVGALPLGTLEEAPATLRAWMHQRTRWMKGWMQTAAVHLRHPRRAIAACGFLRYGAALAICLGTVTTALFGPFLFAAAIHAMVAGDLLRPRSGGEVAMAVFALTLLAVGAATLLASALVALRRIGLMRLAPWLLLLPVYLLLITVASWRAVAEVIVEPHRWNKTEHGLARTTRQTAPQRTTG